MGAIPGAWSPWKLEAYFQTHPFLLLTLLVSYRIIEAIPENQPRLPKMILPILYWNNYFQRFKPLFIPQIKPPFSFPCILSECSTTECGLWWSLPAPASVYICVWHHLKPSSLINKPIWSVNIRMMDRGPFLFLLEDLWMPKEGSIREFCSWLFAFLGLRTHGRSDAGCLSYVDDAGLFLK